MPSNLLKLSSSSMESEFHNRSDFERSGSFDSQGSHCSRSRSSNMDDENLKYLTNEEKNALMFFEETLDAFEDEAEEPPVSLNSSFGHYSPRSTEDSHSDSDDIIDLVQTGHNHEGVLLDNGSGLTSNGHRDTQNNSRPLDVTSSASAPVAVAASTVQREEGYLSYEPPIDYPKFLGAVPTPVILAQKISEKKAEKVHLSMSPKEEKSPDLKKSVATSPIGDDHFTFPGKLNRFPNNISVKLSGKQYNKTIAKAAVNVQERKAQVLANLHGPALFAEEIDGKNSEPIIRRTSFRDVASEQTRYEALTKLGLVKETPTQANSACTSPISNGQHSSMFFPPEIKRRLSNEKVITNTQHLPKILTPESNAKIPNEQNSFIRQNSSKYFTTETTKVPSLEQDNASGPHSPKGFAGESNRRLSNENLITNQHSPKALTPDLNANTSNERHAINPQNASKYFTTETKKVPSIEQDNVSGQHSPKLLVGESNRRLSNEKLFTNVHHSPKAQSPESNKRMPNEHFSNGQNASKFFTTETKRVPSTEQDNVSAQHSPKVLAEGPYRRLSNEQESIGRILRSEPSPFIPLGKTVIIKGDTSAASLDANKRHSSIHINHELKQPNNNQEIKRTYSMPRPSGFRSQGITVQFSGRDSSEESRNNALRKLGLLKGHSGQ
ncbi:proline and serine-rich protein 2 [Mantella aurantiaca]